MNIAESKIKTLAELEAESSEGFVNTPQTDADYNKMSKRLAKLEPLVLSDKDEEDEEQL